MPPESVTPPPTEEQDDTLQTPPPSTTPQTPGTAEVQTTQPETAASIGARPHIRFSVFRWASSGIVRLLYRLWTRIAVHLFPENSKSEQIARQLHIPLPDKLNMSWVNSHLAVGGRIRPEDIPALSLTGITDVIDTRSEYKDDAQALAAEDIDLLYLPIPDTYPMSIEQLMQGAKWANARMKQGRRVLIHCEHGVGRSVLLTCAVLVYDGMHARDALKLVKEKRWQASPNQRQVSRLKEFESAVAERRSA